MHAEHATADPVSVLPRGGMSTLAGENRQVSHRSAAIEHDADAAPELRRSISEPFSREAAAPPGFARHVSAPLLSTPRHVVVQRRPRSSYSIQDTGNCPAATIDYDEFHVMTEEERAFRAALKREVAIRDELVGRSTADAPPIRRVLTSDISGSGGACVEEVLAPRPRREYNTFVGSQINVSTMAHAYVATRFSAV